MFRKGLFIRVLAAGMTAAVIAGPSAYGFAAETETAQEEDKEEKEQEEVCASTELNYIEAETTIEDLIQCLKIPVSIRMVRLEWTCGALEI